jgi:hypothetical protein
MPRVHSTCRFDTRPASHRLRLLIVATEPALPEQQERPRSSLLLGVSCHGTSEPALAVARHWPHCYLNSIHQRIEVEGAVVA